MKEVKQSMPALIQTIRSWAGSKARAVCEAVMASSEARRLMNLPFMFATNIITNRFVSVGPEHKSTSWCDDLC